MVSPTSLYFSRNVGLRQHKGGSPLIRREAHLKWLQVTSTYPIRPHRLILPRMKAGNPEKRNVTPKQAIQILQQNGIEVNEKQAENILDFLYFLAKLVVNQGVDNLRDEITY